MGLTKYLAGDLDFYGIITKSKAPCIYNRMFSWVLDPFFLNSFYYFKPIPIQAENTSDHGSFSFKLRLLWNMLFMQLQ